MEAYDDPCSSHSPSVATCVFHSHEDFDSSAYLFSCGDLSAVLRAVACAEPNPSALAPGAALSVTASYASHCPLTRCHTVARPDAGTAQQLWAHAVAMAARHIFSRGSARRGAAVSGVFVARTAEPQGFRVGLITRGAAQNPQVRAAVAEFAGALPLSESFAALPLCRSLRGGRSALRLWWEPRSERVTPRRPMPAIRVIFERAAAATKGLSSSSSSSFSSGGSRGSGGYGAARVFLCRPAAAVLRGTTRRLLCEAKPRRGGRWAGEHKRKEHRETEHGGTAAGVEEMTALVLPFDDLSVEEEGEHLVGVELEPLPPYRPFVPALYAHLAPFLVVTREDA